MVRCRHIGKFAGIAIAHLVIDYAIREETFRVPDLCQVYKKFRVGFEVQTLFRFISGELDDAGFIDDIHIKLLSQFVFYVSQVHT